MSQGSQSAFDTLYLHYFEPLVKHVAEITKDVAAAEDIVQDTFYKMWERRETFSKYDKIAGWLFVSTYNASMNYLRKIVADKKNQQHIPQAEDTDYKIHEEQFRLMEEAIEQLPPQRKKIFRLCKLEGLTYDQAAEQLGISRNTVKDHLSKAAESIKEHIANKKGVPISRLMMLFITCI